MPTRRLSSLHSLLLGFLMLTTHVWSTVVHAGPPRTCERAFEVQGPAKRLELPGVELADDLGRPTAMRIGHYNLQEFKVEKDKAAFQEVDKPQWAVDLIVHQIRRETPDVLFLSEIAGVRSLEILAKRAGNYEAVSFEGNDKYSRVAVLIRRDLPFRVHIQSHRSLEHRYGDKMAPVFTRDFLVAEFTYPGDSQPTVSIASSHFKSRRHSKFEIQHDPGSSLKRLEQVQTAMSVLKRHQRERSPRATVLVGDFNADIRTDSELAPIRNSGFSDVMRMLDVPQDQRGTHSYFYKTKGTYAQFDGMFVSDEVAAKGAVTSAYVVPDHDRWGNRLPAPRDYADLRTRASDHRMVIMQLDLSKFFGPRN